MPPWPLFERQRHSHRVVGHQHYVCKETRELRQPTSFWGCSSTSRMRLNLTQKLGLLVGEDLVEDVVVPLSLQLEDDSGLLQEVWRGCREGFEMDRMRRWIRWMEGWHDGSKMHPQSHSQVSISADANFPVAPKWIRMNFPYDNSSVRLLCPIDPQPCVIDPTQHPHHSQIVKSCHCGQSWHCQRPPRQG